VLSQVLWELFCYDEPHGGLGEVDVMVAVQQGGARPVVPASMPPSYQRLLQCGWHKHPHMRPSAQQVVDVLRRMQAQLP
jgi:hypothetical protein